MSKSDEKMTVVIAIDGESAEEMFAVGPSDLKNSFFPRWGIKTEDVKSITFRKVTERSEYGQPTHSIVHKDNFLRGEEPKS